MLSRLPFRRKIVLVAVIPILAMIAIALTGYTTIRAVKVGSTNFARAESAQVLVADLLPPPLYLVESWAEVNRLQTETDPAAIAAHEKTIDRTISDYSERFAVWSKDSIVINDKLRAAVLLESDKAAQEFFRIVKADYLPAVEQGRGADARKILYQQLEGLYNRHRAAVVEGVKQANLVKASADSDSRSLVAQRVFLSLMVFLVGLALAITTSVLVARSIRRSLRQVRDGADNVVNTLNATDLDTEIPVLLPVEVETQDELGDAAASFNSVVGTTVQVLERQRQARQKTSELFVNLGRRNQNLVSRQLRLIDELEHSDADPEIITKVFKIDHIATRMRRNAESLLVMAGLETPRRWKNAVAVGDVIRSTVSEVEQFDRVEVGNLPQIKVSGKAAADVSHLLAELVENAVRYSPPDMQVHVVGRMIGDGALRISIVDYGTGMTPPDLEQAALRLGGNQNIDQTQTQYLGHYVVGKLALRHGIKVRLESPGGEGLAAYVELPAEILSEMVAQSEESSEREGFNRGATRQPGGVASPAPAPRNSRQELDHLAASIPKTPIEQQPSPAPRNAARTAAAPNGRQPAPPAGSADAAQAEQLTDAGYRKRTPKKVSDAASIDRFASPDVRPKPRSNDDMRDRLASFTAGKRNANGSGKPGHDNDNRDDTGNHKGHDNGGSQL